jgi:hypothetical protein
MGRKGAKKGKEKKPTKKELDAQKKAEEEAKAAAAAKAAKGDDDDSGSEEEEARRQLSRPTPRILFASNHTGRVARRISWVISRGPRQRISVVRWMTCLVTCSAIWRR